MTSERIGILEKRLDLPSQKDLADLPVEDLEPPLGDGEPVRPGGDVVGVLLAQLRHLCEGEGRHLHQILRETDRNPFIRSNVKPRLRLRPFNRLKHSLLSKKSWH